MCVPKIVSISQEGLVEIKFPFKLRPIDNLKTRRQEYYRNLTRDLLFDLRISPSYNLDEAYKEPKVYSWNVTYADSQVIKAQLTFNNTLYISANDDLVRTAC